MARIVRTVRDGWRGRGPAAVLAAALLVWLVVTVPLATGAESLYLRDVFGNHLPVKAFGAEALARGEVPAFNPGLGLGQPFRGNPSTLAFYPGNLLYLALPLWSAFNLHYALHWLLAFAAMALLARRLGMGAAAALLAALTYAGSGYLLSCLTFYNLLTVAAWWPLVMAGAVAGGARGIAWGGAACGMALLGGEPLTAALGLLPLVLVAVERHGARRGLATVATIGAAGLLVSAPQWVATLRILGFTFRGTHGATLAQVESFALPPLRFLELVLPLPFGWPTAIGSHGWWAWASGGQMGYFLSLHAGILGLWLAAGAARRRPLWALVAVAGLAAAWLGAGAGEVLAAASGGTFRYPQKFLFWFAVALPLLAGWGLDAALARPAPRRRAAWWGAGALALAAAIVLAARPSLVAAAREIDLPGPLDLGAVVATQTLLWPAALAAGAALLLAAAWALGRGWPAAVAGLQLVALLQLAPLVDTVPTEPLRQAPPWLAAVPPGAAVFHTLALRPAWEPTPPYRVPDGSRAAIDLRDALDLAAVPGALFGLTYPLWPDIEGFSTPLHTYLTVELARAPWPARAAWLRALGVDAVVAHRPPPAPGLRAIERVERHGAETWLWAVESPAPAAWWPERVESAPGPQAALGRVAALADPVATVVAARPVEHAAGGTARLVEAAADRVVVDVGGGGGLLVVRRAYHPLFTATSGDRALATLPVQVELTGVEVPPGDHRVVLAVDSTPEAVAGAVALTGLLALLALAVLAPRRGLAPQRAEGAP